MIWSIFPQELIFEDRMPIQTQLVDYKGCRLIVDCSNVPLGKGRVISLLSTCPGDFLRNDIVPGNIIDLDAAPQ